MYGGKNVCLYSEQHEVKTQTQHKILIYAPQLDIDWAWRSAHTSQSLLELSVGSQTA